MDESKLKRKREYTDHYEVSGLSVLPLEDCIWHLEKMDFQVDSKLQFYRYAALKGVEVEGYLAPRADGLTLVKADVHAAPRLKINYTILIIVVWFFVTLPIAFVAGEWSYTKLGLVMAPAAAIGLIWLGMRLGIYRASRREAKRTIDYLYRRFEL